jgi:glycylpeptide N-tetradecanoyltransferase
VTKPKWSGPLQAGNRITADDGAILSDAACRESTSLEPEPLLDRFQWSIIDVDNCEDLQELYELLYNHYVEDKDGKFRCNYSVAFLKWALKPPGWKRDWHVGVRTTPTVEGQKGKLVAFISGIPIALHVRDNRLNAIEINFLTVHHKLRNKRLTPVLIKEITRRCYLDGIYQALYTAGTLLPTPISKCRYYHRSLDWDHLYRNGFGQLPTGSTAMRQRLRYKLPRSTVLPGFRPMEKRDILAVKRLLQNYLQRFSIRQEIDVEEISHWLCSDAGKDVVWSFVVESHGKVTDLISYYVLEVRSHLSYRIVAMC